MITKYLKKTTDDDQMITSIITKYLKKTSCESSVEKVGSNDDLITEILLELPASSLVRFKSVSKHWLSLITNPHLSRLHIGRPLRVSGLFIPIDKTLKQPEYRYIPLNSSNPSRTITFPTPGGPNGITILQSCNGLLFCSNSYGLTKYYVYNPTTGKFTTIPVPQLLPRKDYHRLSEDTTLAFDPLRSPHYKLVYAHWLGNGKFQMVVYSSETQLWKVFGDQPLGYNLWNDVYFNGAVHYVTFSHTRTSIISLKIDEERLERMPMPPIPNNNKCIYFGQSGGRLHLITANDNAASPKFDVYEMKKDCSKWRVRYQVEIKEVYWIEIICIVCGELREEDSFLVFKTLVDGFIRFMKYTFADKTLKMLFQIEDLEGRGAGQPFTTPEIISNILYQSKAFEFIQSLSPV